MATIASNGTDAAMDWEAFVRDGRYADVRATVGRSLPAWMRGQFDPSDFVQEAVLNILERPGSFDEAHSSVGLVTEIARRRLIDRVREVRGRWPDATSRRPVIALGESALRVCDCGPGPVREAEAAECLDRLFARAGNEAGRAIVELKRQGYSAPEAAQRVGWGERRTQRFLCRLAENL